MDDYPNLSCKSVQKRLATTWGYVKEGEEMGQCSNHPDAPHGFDRNASHNAGCYVCECEGWQPPEEKVKMGYTPKLYEQTLSYTQESDTWAPTQDDQVLELKTHRVDDGPNGCYITISTERWALDKDDIDAFCDQLKKALEGL